MILWREYLISGYIPIIIYGMKRIRIFMGIKKNNKFFSSLLIFFLLNLSINLSNCAALPDQDITINNSNINYIGDNASYSFGTISCIIGDVNNDSFEDFITLEYNKDSTSTFFMFFGKSTGWNNGSARMNADVIIHANRPFGSNPDLHHIASLGDVNGDHIDDFAIGVTLNRNGTAFNDPGIVYLIFGRLSWAHDVNIDEIAVASYIGDWPGEMAGVEIGNAGDVNDDGYNDILISAPGGAMNESDLNYSVGKIYLIFGKKSQWMNGVSLSFADVIIFGKDDNNKKYGLGGATGIGDIDNDGFSDFALTSVPIDPIIPYSVHIFFGKKNWSKNIGFNDSDTSINGNQTCSAIGSSITRLGDIDNDGIDDFLISSQTNKIFLVYGHSDKWPKDLPLADLNAFFTGENRGYPDLWFTYGPGDMNNDGCNDIIISSSLYRESPGKVYLIKGQLKKLTNEIKLSPSNQIFIMTSSVTKEKLLPSTEGWGDINGDGFNDLIIGEDKPNINNTIRIFFDLGPLLKNHSPMIDNKEINIETEVGTPIYHKINVTDPDDDALTFKVLTSQANISLNAQGEIFWQPTVAGNYSSTIEVSDGYMKFQIFMNIIVRPYDNPPTYQGPWTIRVKAGEKIVTKLLASDKDGDDLIFSTNTSLNSLNISQDGILSFDSSKNQNGKFKINLIISDGEKNITQQITLIIEKKNNYFDWFPSIPIIIIILLICGIYLLIGKKSE